MSRSLSSQERVRRAQPTRVDISYKLHLPDGTTRDERLPFVLGIIADLTGQIDPDRPDLQDHSRDFVDINRDNFETVLAGAKPRLKFTVKNTLKKREPTDKNPPTGENPVKDSDSTDLTPVDLHIREMNDFHPDSIVQAVPSLRLEQERRKRLENLLNMLGSDPRLEAQLQEIIDNPAKRAEFLARMGRNNDGDASR